MVNTLANTSRNNDMIVSMFLCDLAQSTGAFINMVSYITSRRKYQNIFTTNVQLET